MSKKQTPKVLSYVLGIETVTHKEHNDTADHNDLDCIIMLGLALTLGNQLLANSLFNKYLGPKILNRMAGSNS